MSISKIFVKIAAFIVITLLWAACQKEASNQLVESQNNSSQERLSGVVPDDPFMLSQVPVIMSADYLANGYDPSVNTEGVLTTRGKPDNILPTISITSPTNGATVSGTINVLVNATDNIGVRTVTLSVDGASVSSSSTSPFTNSWNSGLVANGTHTLMVTAKDAAGNQKSSSIQVTVNNVSSSDITAPTVNISSPANGSAYNAGTTVNISLSASDNIGVTSISLSIDGSVVGSGTSSTYNYAWNTSAVASGVHTITAKAYDKVGNVGTKSITVTINTVIVNPPTLPSSIQLVMPPVGNQGGEGSCIAFTTAYGARSCEQYYRTNATSYSYSTNIFSPEYVYNQTKIAQDCGSGTAITLALDLMKNKGSVPWSSMPYTDANGCSVMPTAAQDAVAAGYKIGGYSKMLNNDKTAIKTMLASKHPVIASILIDNYFTNATPGFIWKTAGTGNIGHGLVLCGYDDAKNAYKAVNSWGTAWGDAGYIWIDYDFFPSRAGAYVYVMNY